MKNLITEGHGYDSGPGSASGWRLYPSPNPDPNPHPDPSPNANHRFCEDMLMPLPRFHSICVGLGLGVRG